MCMNSKSEGKHLENAFVLLTKKYEILYKIDE